MVIITMFESAQTGSQKEEQKMIKDAVTRIQEYLQSHETSYTLKRLEQK